MPPFCSVSLLNRYSTGTLLLVADLWLTNDTESVSSENAPMIPVEHLVHVCLVAVVNVIPPTVQRPILPLVTVCV